MNKKQLVKKIQNTIKRRQGQSRCLDEKEIKSSWEPGLKEFKKIIQMYI